MWVERTHGGAVKGRAIFSSTAEEMRRRVTASASRERARIAGRACFTMEMREGGVLGFAVGAGLVRGWRAEGHVHGGITVEGVEYGRGPPSRKVWRCSNSCLYADELRFFVVHASNEGFSKHVVDVLAVQELLQVMGDDKEYTYVADVCDHLGEYGHSGIGRWYCRRRHRLVSGLNTMYV